MVGSMGAQARAFHAISDENRHFKFDNSLPPALAVESGSTVVIRCREACDNQFTPDFDHQGCREFGLEPNPCAHRADCRGWSGARGCPQGRDPGVRP